MIIENESQLLTVASLLAKECSPPLVIYLSGELGAGKTTFSRGFLAGMGYVGKVKSPTYTIVESYPLSQATIYHFDFYRIHDPEELESIGIRDYFNTESICLIEWPELAKNRIPPYDVMCRFSIEQDQRRLEMIGQGIRGMVIVEATLASRIKITGKKE